jgi:hypothetical protein
MLTFSKLHAVETHVIAQLLLGREPQIKHTAQGEDAKAHLPQKCSCSAAENKNNDVFDVRVSWQ